MKRNRIEKKFCLRPLPVLLALFLGLASPEAAFAQCETPAEASGDIFMEQAMDTLAFNLFQQQEAIFDWNNLSNAFVLLSNAWLTYRDNVLQALNTFSTALDADGGTPTGLQAMTRELHVSQVDQTYRLGQLQDAQLMNEEKLQTDKYLNEAQTRYAPSFLACQIDSTGPGLNRAYQISRALNRTLAMDDEPRREDAAGTWPAICDGSVTYTDINGKTYSCTDGNWTALPTTSFNGLGQDVNAAYNEYVSKYCDNTMGDQGCTKPGVDAGREKDIGALLWGSQLTIDPTNPENIRIVQDSLRYLIDPLAPDPIPETVVPMPGARVAQAAAGRAGILERNAESAYINTIYNVLGAMLSERIGGSKVDVSMMRAAAGLPTPSQNFDSPTSAGSAATSPTMPGTTPNVGASYREIQEAMTRDRFDDPQYLIKMLSNPEQVMRERNTLSALRLQTMNDIYRRQEELLFMEAAEYGRDLNGQIPHAETGKMALPH